MSTLIHNIVKTDRGDYTFHTREEAEAFFIAVSLRERERRSPMAASEKPPSARPRGRSGSR